LPIRALLPTSMLPLLTTAILCWRSVTTRNCSEKLHTV
jgi:hypothetical protein